MFNRRITAGLLSGVVAVGLVLSAQTAGAIKAQDAAKVEAEAKATLAKFQTGTKGARGGVRQRQGYPGVPEDHQGGLHHRRRSQATAC